MSFIAVEKNSQNDWQFEPVWLEYSRIDINNHSPLGYITSLLYFNLYFRFLLLQVSRFSKSIRKTQMNFFL